MFARIGIVIASSLVIGLFTCVVRAEPIPDSICTTTPTHLTANAIAKALGWVETPNTRCGGYYLEAPLTYPKELLHSGRIAITSNQGLLFAQHGTSISQGKIQITREGEQITANKGYLYRDPNTGKISSVDLFGNVNLHEPNQLVIATCAHYDFVTHAKSLNHILYRSTIYSRFSNPPPAPSYQEQQEEHPITQLSAWGQAHTFAQEQPKIYRFNDVSYSTCPPMDEAWKIKASDMTLNKNTGRGQAQHARLYLRGVPVLYTPYLSFPIDSRRETGFLFPTLGSYGQSGHYILAPFYWNMAPNYDMTITPGYLFHRGTQVSDLFRYLTPTSSGNLTAAILPHDKEFKKFQETEQNIYQNSTSSFTQADLRRLENASTTRKSITWVHDQYFNDQWKGDINFNYVSDDYYLRDLNSSVNAATENQLLQQAEVNYTGPHWDFLTRLQAYETLHPVDQTTAYLNQYSRVPQFVLNGRYPDKPLGLDYFISNDLTRFTFHNTPGDPNTYPIGTRANIQPGISKPYKLPYFYFIPRAQFALTQYELGNVANNFPKAPARALPIFDINSGLYFDRHASFLNHSFRQTLEPQIYYTYIPYRNQNELPIFDTNLNTLTYDQLFIYNRFSGLDRIGDANQVSVGITTRFINTQSGYEKIRAGIGQIYYFGNRRVTLCSGFNCSLTSNNPNDTSDRSPLSGMLTYNVNPNWSATANTIWNSHSKRLDNQNVGIQYRLDERRVVNVGYNFARNGDLFIPNVPLNSASNNLSQTDFSFAWPVTRDWSSVGRWTENWNQKRMQNLLYGLQYDSCCWAVRFVAGRTFAGLSPSNSFVYNNQFYVQFALKGLGNYGPGGDPSGLLSSSVPGYQSNFGRDF